MKKETYANKLAALLGITDKVEVKAPEQPSKAKNHNFVEVSEDSIQSFREAQGIIYFLQAPALFSYRICKHCNEEFMVSRKFVGYCSYTCIAKSLEELGITWKKGHDIEALVNDPQVYEGNEPLWIRNLDQLRAALERLTEPVLT